MNRHAGEGLGANNKPHEQSALVRESGVNSVSVGRGIFLNGDVNSLPGRAPDVAIGAEIVFVALRCREMDFILRCSNVVLAIRCSKYIFLMVYVKTKTQ